MKIKVPNCVSMEVPERRWFVVRLKTAFNLTTKGGLTDQIFAELKDKGYDVYCPRSRFDRFNRRMRVMAEWSAPLIPGYLFVAHPREGGQVDNWDEVRGVKGVAGPLHGEQGPLVIPALLIERLMSEEFASTYDDTQAGRRHRGETEQQRLAGVYQKGKTFLVEDGPFAAFLARVESVTDKGSIEALVEIFGRYVPVQFEPRQLKDEVRDDAA